jgi:hypothetical protein
MGKTKTYTNVLPLDVVSLKLGNHLQKNKNEVSYSNDKEQKTWFFIQTRKHGYLESSNKKCVNITIKGTREQCIIKIDDGVWGENTTDFPNPPKLIPYEGILETDKKSLSPIISQHEIWVYLDKNMDYS